MLFERSKNPGWGGFLLSSILFILEYPRDAGLLPLVPERPHPTFQNPRFFRSILGQTLCPAISLSRLRLQVFPYIRSPQIAYRLV
jgi:hypothetical protein